MKQWDYWPVRYQRAVTCSVGPARTTGTSVVTVGEVTPWNRLRSTAPFPARSLYSLANDSMLQFNPNYKNKNHTDLHTRTFHIPITFFLRLWPRWKHFSQNDLKDKMCYFTSWSMGKESRTSEEYTSIWRNAFQTVGITNSVYVYTFYWASKHITWLSLFTIL